MKKLNKVDNAEMIKQWSAVWQLLHRISPGFNHLGHLLGIIHSYASDSDNFAFPQTPPDEKLGSTFDFFRRDPVAAAYCKDQEAVIEFKARIKAGEDVSDFHDRGYDICSLALAWFFDEKEPLPIHQLPTLLNFHYAVVRKKEFEIKNVEDSLAIQSKPLISFLIDDHAECTDDGNALLKELQCGVSKTPLDIPVLERFKHELLRLPKFEQTLFNFPHYGNKLVFDLEVMGLSSDTDDYMTFPSEGVLIAYQRAVYGDNAVISAPVLGTLSKEEIEKSGRVGQRYKNVFTSNSPPPPKIHGELNMDVLAASFHDAIHAALMSIVAVPHRAFVWLMLDKIRALSQKYWSAESWYLVDFIFPKLYQKSSKINPLKGIFSDSSIIPELPNLSMLAYTLVEPEELKAIGLDYQQVTATAFAELLDSDYRDYLKILVTHPELHFKKIKNNKLAIVVRDSEKNEDVIMNLHNEWNDFTDQAQIQAQALHPIDPVVMIEKWGLIQQRKIKDNEQLPSLQPGS